MLAFAIAAGLAPRNAEAQRLQVHPAIFGSAGISLGVGDSNTVLSRSPTSLSLQVSLSNSERPAFRYGLSLRGELETILSFGVVPQVFFVHSVQRLTVGLLAGIPLVIAPRSLYGIEAGASLSIAIVERFAVAVQMLAAFYPLGNDLPEDSLLVMVQVHVGIEAHF
jgi:hypothetical protein